MSYRGPRETLVLLDGVSATGAGDVANPKSHADTGLVQIDISGAATVQIQGRLASDLDWIDLLDADATASTLKVIAACPEMRANVSAYTSGTVDVVLKA